MFFDYYSSGVVELVSARFSNAREKRKYIPCPKCGFGLKDTKIDYDLEKENITLHNVPALECPSCGYVSMNVEQADHFIELLERIRGVPNSQKITMHEKIISDGTRQSR